MTCGSGGSVASARAAKVSMIRLTHSSCITVSGVLPPVRNAASSMFTPRAMVEGMKPGAVVVDLAAETGGNVEGSVAGEEVQVGEVTVWGAKDVPSQMPVDASRLYARNVSDLVLLMTSGDGDVVPDFDDEVVAGCWVTRDGDVREGILP